MLMIQLCRGTDWCHAVFCC